MDSGDVLILDTGLVWDGYFCDFDRNFVIGTASDPVREAHRKLWDATQAGIEAAKPGVTCRELYETIRTALPGPASDGGRFGHGLGMQLTEHPSIAEFDDTVLDPGMVLTIEPGYEFSPGKIMVHEENLVVQKNGPSLLSARAEREISVL